MRLIVTRDRHAGAENKRKKEGNRIFMTTSSATYTTIPRCFRFSSNSDEIRLIAMDLLIKGKFSYCRNYT